MKKIISNTTCWLSPKVELVTSTNNPIAVIERAGRFSTRSQDKHVGMEFLNKRWKDGHYSIFEHIHLGFELSGISRIITHELVRHRHLSFTQSSTRYTNLKEMECVIPPGIINKNEVYRHIDAFNKQKNEMINLLTDGCPPERARYSHPPYMECCMYISGNYRSWIELLQKRLIKNAAPEFIRLAKYIHNFIYEYLPLVNIEFPKINTDIVEV